MTLLTRSELGATVAALARSGGASVTAAATNKEAELKEVGAAVPDAAVAAAVGERGGELVPEAPNSACRICRAFSVACLNKADAAVLAAVGLITMGPLPALVLALVLALPPALFLSKLGRFINGGGTVTVRTCCSTSTAAEVVAAVTLTVAVCGIW